jgi:hypothetical protein
MPEDISGVILANELSVGKLEVFRERLASSDGRGCLTNFMLHAQFAGHELIVFGGTDGLGGELVGVVVVLLVLFALSETLLLNIRDGPVGLRLISHLTII